MLTNWSIDWLFLVWGIFPGIFEKLWLFREFGCFEKVGFGMKSSSSVSSSITIIGSAGMIGIWICISSYLCSSSKFKSVELSLMSTTWSPLGSAASHGLSKSSFSIIIRPFASYCNFSKLIRRNGITTFRLLNSASCDASTRAYQLFESFFCRRFETACAVFVSACDAFFFFASSMAKHSLHMNFLALEQIRWAHRLPQWLHVSRKYRLFSSFEQNLRPFGHLHCVNWHFFGRHVCCLEKKTKAIVLRRVR